MSITIDHIKEAFIQLKRHYYYEKLDLLNRNRIVEFEDKYDFKLEPRFRDIKSWVEIFNGNALISQELEDLLQSIKLNFYVKKIKDKEGKPDSNFITDKVPGSEGHTIERQHLFAELPIELQILGVLWLNRIGGELDKEFINNCFGNRIFNKEKEKLKLKQKGRLYKIFHFQYAKWWKEGLKKAKSILSDDGQDVIMLNFDLKDYYHNISLNEQRLREAIGYNDLSSEDQFLHIVLEKVLTSYNEKRSPKTKEFNPFESLSNWCLPIGYIASPVIANYYLNSFDQNIINNIRPAYYGRYVDDILIVFRSTIPKDLDNRNEDVKNILSRNKAESSSKKETLYRFLKYLEEYFSYDSKKDSLLLDGFENIELQQEKLFVYELDKLSPNSIIEKFIEEQEAKNYEFQFESEEKDTISDDFGELMFSQNFESEDASKAKIKNISDNKFKVSVYLSRLIKRAGQGNITELKYLKKMVAYYKGSNCLRNWPLWEKICLSLIACDKPILLNEFLISAMKSIKDLEQSIDDHEIDNELVKMTMEKVLALGLSNSLAACPNFPVKANLKEEHFYNIHKVRRSAFARNEFHSFPVIGLIDKAIHSDISFLNRKQVIEFTSSSVLNIGDFFYDYSPIHIKYWEVCLIEWLNKLQRMRYHAGEEVNKTYLENKLSFQEIQIPAFEKYYKINFGKASAAEIKRKRKNLFFKVGEKRLTTRKGGKFDRKPNQFGLYKSELLVQATDHAEKLTFALVNEEVDSKNYIEAAKGNPVLNGRLKTSLRILDEAQSKGADIVVQPELSVPFDFISDYCSYCDRHQIAIVAGIEHKRIKDVVFNFIMTLLPIKVEGIYKDAIPVMRVKNHYAPREEEMIHEHRATVPKPTSYVYHLFNWKGLYFTNYYCYELADIHHRSIFQGEIDVLIAPVWNADTNYYNSIVESGAREIHCVFSQVNTAGYGDTRWTLPSRTEEKNPIRVKGGTTSKHPYTIALAEFSPKSLREFQVLDYIGQKKNASFKPTPPDYPKEKAEKRLKNQSFYINE